MELRELDALKTGRAAAASVRFLAGGRLEVEEQSLVVIEAQPQPAPASPASPGKASPPVASGRVARVEQGTVRGISEPGAPVTVVTPDGQKTSIVAEGKEAVPFRVRVRPGGKLEVAVLKGSAQVSTAGAAPVTVKEQQAVEVSGRRVSAPAPLPGFPELISPAVDEKFHAGIRVPLRWRPVSGAALYRVQVSDSVGFERRLADETVTVAEYNLAGPTPGRTYVWRVSSVDAAGREGEFGFARRFEVVSAAPPPAARLVGPPDNAGFQVAGAPRPITFSWSGEAEQYELVIARAPSLSIGTSVLRRRLKGMTSFSVTTLAAGTYYWGVYAVAPGARRPLFEKARRLVVARRLPPGVKAPDRIDWK
jgi:hypothetical protein